MHAFALRSYMLCRFFFFQAEDGIRDVAVTGVQTCALPISNEDSVDKVDSTPLRRVGVLATASAVWLATAEDDQVIRLAGLTMSSSFAKIHLRRLGLTSTPGGFPRRMEPGQRLNPSVEQAAQAMMSLNILLTENGRLRFQDLTRVFGSF